MKMLTVLGIHPKIYKNSDPLTCVIWIYGCVTKRTRRSKSLKLPKDRSTTIICPEQCISAAQMEIREEGFIAQLIYFLTKQRYKYLW